MTDLMVSSEVAPVIQLQAPPSQRTVFYDADAKEMFVVDGGLKRFEVYGKVVEDPDEITKAFCEWVGQFVPQSS